MSDLDWGPVAKTDMDRFLSTFFYLPEVFYIDGITTADSEAGIIEATFDTTRHLPYASTQRTSEGHPAHVAAPEILMATGSLGCLHAYLFHGCRWDEGWAGFGNRIHRADFKALAHIGPPIELHSEESRRRVGPKRVMLRLSFKFHQEGRLIYRGDQSAIFVKEHRDFPVAGDST